MHGLRVPSHLASHTHVEVVSRRAAIQQMMTTDPREQVSQSIAARVPVYERSRLAEIQERMAASPGGRSGAGE